MNVLIWFKRDLRLTDHPALTLAAGLAAGGAAVLPIYIVEPDLWAEPDAAARQWEFVAESLPGLREGLAAAGAPLVLRVGEAVAVLERMRRQHRIGHLVSQAEQGHPWSAARNTRVAAWARGAGVIWHAPPPLPCGAAPLPAPTGLRPVSGLEPGAIPQARALRLAEDRCPHRQTGGRAQGLALLQGFLARGAAGPRGAVVSALQAERAASRLSPYLAQGVLSLPEAARGPDLAPGPTPPALARLQSRLALRDRAIPTDTDTPGSALAEEGRLFAPASIASRQAALLAGETGLPFLDAALRYLAATGWLDVRLRAMVAAVACDQLGLDAATAGAALARRCTDYDPAVHWAQMRRIAAAGGIDPIRLGLRLDPEGAFIRRWLPELAAVPDAFVHSPWRWEGAARLLGRRYPEPLVNPAPRLRPIQKPVQKRRPEPERLTLIEDAAPRNVTAGLHPATKMVPHTHPDRMRRAPERSAAGGQLCLGL